jgi:broad specificity phosphatase PhoE
VSITNSLIVARHFESAGNESARIRSSYYKKMSDTQHTSEWPLTQLARYQQLPHSAAFLAKVLAQYPEEIPILTITSPYRRAVDSAAGLLPKVKKWTRDSDLIEMEGGLFELMGEESYAKEFPEMIKKRDKDPYNWIPQFGESFAKVSDGRIGSAFMRIVKRMKTEQAIAVVVCHASVIQVIDHRVRGDSVEKFNEVYLSGQRRVSYGQVIHYFNDTNDPRHHEVEFTDMQTFNPAAPTEICHEKI